MAACYTSGDFQKYFNENMNALGLTTPSTLFETSEKAIATAVLLLTAINQLGKAATMAEIAGATVTLESWSY